MSGVDRAKHFVHGVFKDAAERVLPVRKESGFRAEGVLTPEEFVAAGDFLVGACPTWRWEAGDGAKARPYLPPGKQYLVTRNVPCLRRAAAFADAGDALPETEVEGEDGWLAAGETGGAGADGDADAVDMSLEAGTSGSVGGAGAATRESVEVVEAEAAGGDSDSDDIPDMADFEEEEEEEDQAAAAPAPVAPAGSDPAGDDGILRTRTYDLSITYDKYYQTPRFWLVGYAEDRSLLQPEKSLEDVSSEHAQKTITIDPHPHLNLSAASIHPCRHASVMKKIMAQMGEGGDETAVEHYMLIFLKFIASIVPTIEYDYTLSA